jgi:ATP-binding protein involved in chromosome partitioning
MNPFFGKKQNLPSLDDASIDAVLLSYHIAIRGSLVSIAAFVEQIHTEKHMLQLDLALPSDVTKSPEVIGDDLQQLLAPYGIKQVRINLVWSLSDMDQTAQIPTQPDAEQGSSGAPHADRSIDPKAAGKGADLASQHAVQAHDPAYERAIRQSEFNVPQDLAAKPAPKIADPEPQPRPKPSNPEKPDSDATPQDALTIHPRIKQVVLVSSAKGGVGKSTTAVNLALALQKSGLKTGLLDADIYGPSVPMLLGVRGQVPDVENDAFVPIEAHGLAMLSIGNLTGDDDTPIVWRGPKATGALLQLFNQTNWPMLDVLIIDMPPGTGDLQLTIAQRVKVTGALVVTTPQDIACIDAKKGIAMFEKVGIKVLGLIENMSMHVCENCGHESHVFGEGGADQIAKLKGVPVLAKVPLNAEIRENADRGYPSVLAEDSAAPVYAALAEAVKNELAMLESGSATPRFF